MGVFLDYVKRRQGVPLDTFYGRQDACSGRGVCYEKEFECVIGRGSSSLSWPTSTTSSALVCLRVTPASGRGADRAGGP
jgi:hypothetical protein